MSINSKDLVKKAKTGDADAFDKLYRLHIKIVYAYVSRFISCEADVKDIVSIVFTKTISKIKEFKGLSSFTTWIIRIADNTVKDFFRKASRYSDEPAEDISVNPVQEETVNSNIIKTTIHESLEILTPKQREVLVLHGLQEYTFKEVSHNLSTTERAAKSRYYSAIERLRKHLSQNLFVQEYLQTGCKYNEKTKFQRTRLNRNNRTLLTKTG